MNNGAWEKRFLKIKDSCFRITNMSPPRLKVEKPGRIQLHHVDTWHSAHSWCVGGWDLTQHLGELASFHPHCETPHSDTHNCCLQPPTLTQKHRSLSLHVAATSSATVCRIRRGVCFRNRAECYWPDGRNSGMHRAAPSVPCLLWGKVCCCCDTRNVSVPMLSKTNYHYKHLDLHANIHHNSNRDGRESYV
jgi:hypothetical protein